ncbi:MAG: heme exporter protein CcmB [Acidobacteriota bacterium]
MSTWLREVVAIFVKEWRCELRTRVALSTVVLFAVTTLVVVSLALGPAGTSPELRPALPVLLWIILLFAATAGLPRAFVHEEETGTADALRLASSPTALFLGKSLYNLALILALEAVVAPIFVGMLRLPVASPLDFLGALLAGAVGLAFGSTLIAAMVAQARLRGPLFAVLAFPVLLPLLKLAIDATYAAVEGDPAAMAIRLSLLYDSMLTVAGLMLFPAVWNP